MLSKEDTQKKSLWWKGGSLYQVYPRSFCDQTGDGVGDLKGLSSKLEYIASLGVSGLWLGPVFKSPMVDFGYDVSDYLTIDPVFGSNDDFDVFLNKAHDLNLKVILDLVLSHTSDQHQWFKESCEDPSGRYGDWYVWADGEGDEPPNNWLSVFGGPAWSWNEQRGQFYLHNFLKEQPDLNFHNKEVQDAVLDLAKYWLDKGVDGFRLDACNCYFQDSSLRSNPISMDNHSHVQDETNPYFEQVHLYDKSQPENREFLMRLRQLCDQYKDCFLVGEIFCDREEQTTREYTEEGFPLHSAYNFSLLQNDRREGLFRDTVNKYFSISETTSWSLSNHDVMRVVSRWPDRLPVTVRAKAYMTLLLGLPGLSFIYQGEELGLTEALLAQDERMDPFGENMKSQYPGRDGCRTPIPWNGSLALHCGFSEVEPWLPIPDDHTRFSVLSQEEDENSSLNRVRELLKLRNQQHVFQDGHIQFWRDDHEMIAYSRWDDKASYLVVASFSAGELKLENVPVKKILESVSEGVYFNSQGELHLDPGGMGILEIEAFG